MDSIVENGQYTEINEETQEVYIRPIDTMPEGNRFVYNRIIYLSIEKAQSWFLLFGMFAIIFYFADKPKNQFDKLYLVIGLIIVVNLIAGIIRWFSELLLKGMEKVTVYFTMSNTFWGVPAVLNTLISVSIWGGTLFFICFDGLVIYKVVMYFVNGLKHFFG